MGGMDLGSQRPGWSFQILFISVTGTPQVWVVSPGNGSHRAPPAGMERGELFCCACMWRSPPGHTEQPRLSLRCPTLIIYEVCPEKAQPLLI